MLKESSHSGTHRPTWVQHLPSHLRPLNLSELGFLPLKGLTGGTLLGQGA